MKKLKTRILFTCVFLLGILYPSNIMAQGPAGGAEGLNEAANQLRTWIAPVETIIYVIAVIVGLVGGLRITQKLYNGDRDVNKDFTNYGGGVVFLCVVGLILRAVFLGE